MSIAREKLTKVIDDWCDQHGVMDHNARWQLRHRIRALSVSPAEEGKSPTAEDAARLILECTDIISEATAKKLAERIRALGTGSREERSQADPGERKMERKQK